MSAAIINLPLACMHTPAAVYAVEKATGLVATRFRPNVPVIRLVPPLSDKEVA